MQYKVAILAKTLAELLVRLVNNSNEFNAIGHNSLDAMCLESLVDFDIVLVGGGISDADIELINKEILKNGLETKLIKHYGGGSGLLLQELYEAINKT